MSTTHLPRPMRILLAMTLVSCLGSGLTLPFLLVYLHDLRHLPLPTTGLLLAVPAVAGLVATPAMGVLIDTVGSRAVLVAALCLSAVGSAGLPAVHDAWWAIAPLGAFGLGEAGLLSALNTLFAELLEDQALLVRAFSIEFTLVNVGIGAGALAAGSLVSLSRPDTFTLVYLLDALSFAIPAIVVSRLSLQRPATPVRSGSRREKPRRPGDGVRGYRLVLDDRRFLRYALLAVVLGLCSYGALGAAFVGYSTTTVHASTSLIAKAFAVNTAVIVAFQQLVTRAVTLVRRTSALAASGLGFALAWLVEWFAGRAAGTTTGEVLVVVFGVVFALGEMALSPVRGVLVNALASDELRGRYNAAGLAAFQLANVVAPAGVGALLGASLGGPMLLGLAVLGGLAALYALGLGRHLSPTQDNRPVLAGQAATPM